MTVEGLVTQQQCLQQTPQHTRSKRTPPPIATIVMISSLVYDVDTVAVPSKIFP